MRIKLENGKLISGMGNANKTVDMVIEDGIISMIGDATEINADKTVDCSGKFIVPSVTDIHTHVYPGKTALGVEADEIGINQGAGTIVDAGSAGCDDYPEFYEEVIKKAHTSVKAFINYSKIGLTKDGMELSKISYFDEDKLTGVIEKYPQSIVGIKLRASASVVGDLGIEAIKRGVNFARRVKLPVMVHIGNYPPAIEEILPLLGKGDIVTHIFHGKNGGILTEKGSVKSIVRQKYEEGVIYDIGHGSASFDFGTAERGIKEGIIPFTISSDLHARSFKTKLRSLSEVMTKCLICGMEERDIIKAVTLNPTRITGGTSHIFEGQRAAIAVIEVLPIKSSYNCNTGKSYTSDRSFNISLASDKNGNIREISSQVV